jgi:hypothetical protein
MDLVSILLIGVALLLVTWVQKTPKDKKRIGGKRIDADEETMATDVWIYNNLHPDTISGGNVTHILSRDQFLNYLNPEISNFGKINNLINLTYGGEAIMLIKRDLFHAMGSYHTNFVTMKRDIPEDYFDNLAKSFGVEDKWNSPRQE